MMVIKYDTSQTFPNGAPSVDAIKLASHVSARKRKTQPLAMTFTKIAIVYKALHLSFEQFKAYDETSHIPLVKSMQNE